MTLHATLQYQNHTDLSEVDLRASAPEDYKSLDVNLVGFYTSRDQGIPQLHMNLSKSGSDG